MQNWSPLGFEMEGPPIQRLKLGKRQSRKIRRKQRRTQKNVLTILDRSSFSCFFVSNSDGLLPTSDGIQPSSGDIQPNSKLYDCRLFELKRLFYRIRRSMKDFYGMGGRTARWSLNLVIGRFALKDVGF